MPIVCSIAGLNPEQAHPCQSALYGAIVTAEASYKLWKENYGCDNPRTVERMKRELDNLKMLYSALWPDTVVWEAK